MSLSNAESYARRAQHSSDVEEVGRNTRKAIEELIQEIRRLESRVSYVESRVSYLESRVR